MGTVRKGTPRKCFLCKTGSLQCHPALRRHHCKQVRYGQDSWQEN
ncbi:rCG37940 [Rattus norvegicus]|uniref:RCG37940 n=1 Tax=Rattus norvegicus TaxID=10116 RepID=A6K5V6_RAT|nr:rCG37940 [Rattus norvegicus]